MVLAGGAFVINDSFLKFALAELPPMQTLMLRGAAGLFWCLPLVLAMGYGRQLPLAFDRWVLLRSLFELAAILTFIHGLKHMPIADVTAIYQISPLLVMLGAAWIWRTHVSRWQMLLAGIGMAGALMIAQPGSSTASWFVLFPFLTAIGAAARDLVTRKTPANIPGLVVAISTIIVVLAGASIMQLAFGSWVPPSRSSLLALLGSGLFLTAGHTFIFLAYRHASVPAVAPFGYSFTGWALLAGVVAFGDLPNNLALAGMALIVMSGIAAVLAEKSRSGP